MIAVLMFGMLVFLVWSSQEGLFAGYSNEHPLLLALGATVFSISTLFLFLLRKQWEISRPGSNWCILTISEWSSAFSKGKVQKVRLPKGSKVLFRMAGSAPRPLGASSVFEVTIKSADDIVLVSERIACFPRVIAKVVQEMQELLADKISGPVVFRFFEGWVFNKVGIYGVILGISLCLVSLAI